MVASQYTYICVLTATCYSGLLAGGNYGIVFYKWVLTIGKNREESIENPDLVYYTYISNIE